MSEPADQLLTVHEVASYLRLNPLTIYSYINKGQLPAVKLGRHYRIDRSDLNQFISQMKSKNY
jgi:excisionase family DNA binding protein